MYVHKEPFFHDQILFDDCLLIQGCNMQILSTHLIVVLPQLSSFTEIDYEVYNSVVLC